MPVTIIALSVLIILALIHTWRVAASVGRKAGYKAGFVNGNKYAELHYHRDKEGEWLSPEHETQYRDKTNPDNNVGLQEQLDRGENNWH